MHKKHTFLRVVSKVALFSCGILSAIPANAALPEHCATGEGDTCTACESGYVLNNGACTEQIKIATTKFVDEEFKAAELKLAETVETIEEVVSNTITQTGQIATLQSEKQTRPDETCPAGKKCLLVTDENGTPHWYEIIEPTSGGTSFDVNAFILSVLNYDESACVAAVTAKGLDRDWCSVEGGTLLWGDDISVYANAEAAAEMGLSGPGQFVGDVMTGDMQPWISSSGFAPITNNTDWAIKWDNHGTVYGTSACNGNSGIIFYEEGGPTISNTEQANTGGQYCWCKITGVSAPDSTTPLPAVSRWEFLHGDFGSDSGCASGCASSCGAHAQGYSLFRGGLFGSINQ